MALKIGKCTGNFQVVNFMQISSLQPVFREHKAQRMLTKEVTKQLPSDLSKNTIEKRIERARKVYDLFSNIGYDKIQRVKTFSASHIYRLSWDDIDTLEDRLLRHSRVIFSPKCKKNIKS